ncbi:MAG: phosphoenolpyruvate carboxylase [Alphaproteobacteria bacterium]|nr:phosphoenolpyruvate carboxylase [Alphaproteobacteria bacterium]
MTAAAMTTTPHINDRITRILRDHPVDGDAPPLDFSTPATVERYLFWQNFKHSDPLTRELIQKLEATPLNEMKSEYGLDFPGDKLIHLPNKETKLLSEISVHDLIQAYSVARSRARRQAEDVAQGKVFDEHPSQTNWAREWQDISHILDGVTQSLFRHLSNGNEASETLNHLARYLTIKENMRTLTGDWELRDKERDWTQRFDRIFDAILEKSSGPAPGKPMTTEELADVLRKVKIRIASTVHPTDFQGSALREGMQNIGDALGDIDTELSNGMLPADSPAIQAFKTAVDTALGTWHSDTAITTDRKITVTGELTRDQALAERNAKQMAQAMHDFNEVAERRIGVKLSHEQFQQAVWPGFDHDGRPDETAATLKQAVENIQNNETALGYRVGELRHNAGIHEKLLGLLIARAVRDGTPGMDTVIPLLGGKTYPDLDGAQKTAVLEEIMRRGVPLFPAGETPGHVGSMAHPEDTATLLATLSDGLDLKGLGINDKDMNFIGHTIRRSLMMKHLQDKALAEGKPTPCDTLILANYFDTSDYLEAMLVLKQAGIVELDSSGKVTRADVDIVPLIEDDKAYKQLEENPTSLRDNAFARDMMHARGDKLAILWGHSDSGKSLGFFGAQVAIRKSKQAVSNNFGEDGVTVEHYDGAGWEPERGGGGYMPKALIYNTMFETSPTLRATAAQGDAARKIASSPFNAYRFFDSIIEGLLKRAKISRALDDRIENAKSAIYDRLAAFSAGIYQKEISTNEPDIVNFILNTGAFLDPDSSSRPEKRGDGNTKFEDIRAIKAGLSSTLIASTFLHHGTGRMLQELLKGEKGEFADLQIRAGDGRVYKGAQLATWLYENSVFFRNTINQAALASEMADEQVAALYARRSETSDKDLKILENVQQELHLIRATCRTVAGDKYPYYSTEFHNASVERVEDGTFAHLMQAHALQKMEDARRETSAPEQLEARADYRSFKAIAKLGLNAIHEAYQAGLQLMRPPLELSKHTGLGR